MSGSKRRLKSFLKYNLNNKNSKLSEYLEDLRKRYGYIFNKYQDLAIENYELKKELEKEKGKVKGFMSINNTLDRILRIAEKNIVEKDLRIQLLELYRRKGK
jgi:regulator of replication initiation timing